jgi:hypothetical protein
MTRQDQNCKSNNFGRRIINETGGGQKRRGEGRGSGKILIPGFCSPKTVPMIQRMSQGSK